MLLRLSNLESAVDGGAESAARAGVAEARDETCLAVEKDENEASRAGRGRPPPGPLPFVSMKAVRLSTLMSEF
jgi:hypothetical protein